MSILIYKHILLTNFRYRKNHSYTKTSNFKTRIFD